MPASGTPQNPFTTFSASTTSEHWTNGNGATVFVDMSSHLTQGAGNVFSIQNFGQQN